MPQLIATWNPARSVWETNQTALCGHSALFSETWPAWGMTRDGQAFALPTLVPPTDDSGCSSLPTPTVNDSGNGGISQTRRNSPGLVAVDYLTQLPTPRATDGTKGGPNQRGSSGDLMLPSAVVQLLPTPVADHSRGLPSASTDYASLPNALCSLSAPDQ
jgi:hypothetical protein